LSCLCFARFTLVAAAVPVTEKDQAKLAKEKIKLDKEKEKKKEKQMKTKLRVKTPGEIHITLVGDKGSSKTTILKSFAQDATKDVSGVFECVSYPITITGVKDKYILRLFDTDPDELFSRIRAITYKTTDIFVICFDLTNEDTFKNCRSWYAEVNQLSAKSPVLLVGTKV
jgi:small GTP-binding protein